MAGNSMLDLQLAETPANRYRKAHRHTSDVFILILAGEGYSLVWSGDDVEHRQRINWRTGTLFAPPTFRYHQHLNTGPGPARHLAISAPTLVRNIGLRFADQLEDDPPGVRDEWEATLRARQATPR
jgi:gentisate 1,2-dioxygenase